VVRQATRKTHQYRAAATHSSTDAAEPSSQATQRPASSCSDEVDWHPRLDTRPQGNDRAVSRAHRVALRVAEAFVDTVAACILAALSRMVRRCEQVAVQAVGCVDALLDRCPGTIQLRFMHLEAQLAVFESRLFQIGRKLRVFTKQR
jgi:hypothetical protein